MGLFAPKISAREMEYVRSRLDQLNDSIKLVNSTVKPDVFFKRLNMALDILMELRSYEKFGIFKGAGPTSDYNTIIRNLESTVDDFLDRAIADNQNKIDSLKTEKAKLNNKEKFASSLIVAFDRANTFWSGSSSQTRVVPHYSGPLFAENNYRRVQDLFRATAVLDVCCGNCGKKLDQTANFCPERGTAIRKVALI